MGIVYTTQVRPDVPTLGEFYRFSWRLGLLGLRSGRHIKMGLARILNPLSYPRYMEYDLALRDLHLVPGMTVLDIGSPKLLPVLLASRMDINLWITDLRDYFIPFTQHCLTVLGRGREIGKRLHLEIQDGRNLSYGEGSFDRIFAVSVIEHIPDDGDSLAMAEIARVLKPGGIAAITVPYAHHYAEELIARDVYERRRLGSELVFFQRRYDDAALQNRLIEPSGLEVIALRYFGEPGVRFEPTWNRIPMAWKIPLLWAQPLIARKLLRELGLDGRAKATGAALVVRKPDGPAESHRSQRKAKEDWVHEALVTARRS